MLSPPGEKYYRESGKWEGEIFSRALHTHCYLMEKEYCCEVDNEFTYDEILDYIAETYCGGCGHAACNEGRDDYTECEHLVTDCPKIQAALIEKYGEVATQWAINQL